jgi:hypothetical protein
MKEASGELSMTAIAVVAIAAIGVVFTTLVWPSIKSTITRNTYCSQTISCDNCSNGVCTCTYLTDDGSTGTVQCADKDS